MRITAIVLSVCLILVLFSGCAGNVQADIAATTLPVYDMTVAICAGTPLHVTRLITEEVSCLHDYALNVHQVKAAEAAEVIVMNGAGLEDFLDGLLVAGKLIDASENIALICPEESHSGHSHEHGHDHAHDRDPHIWLSPKHAATMAENICHGLSRRYPEYEETFLANLEDLKAQLEELQRYGNETLSSLSCREMITFHDGFSYFAEAFDLTILEAVEEESGSEASAKELIHLIEEVEHHALPAIFTERNSSASAASIISRETGAAVFSLDMGMSSESYFDAMYHNIDTVKEALG